MFKKFATAPASKPDTANKKAGVQAGFVQQLLLKETMQTIAELGRNSKKTLPKPILGGRARTDLRGLTFDLLTVMDFSSADANGSRWLCNCACGRQKIIRGASLLSGASGSCGCRQFTHLHDPSSFGNRLKDHPLYSVWKGIIYRCTNPKAEGWKDYGGRGISVAEEWLNFATFSADMSPKPEGHQIDRIDNNLGYSKGNCRWVTGSENCRNRRDNVLVEFEGRIVTVAEASELSGIPRPVLYARLRSSNAEIFRAVDLTKGVQNINNRNWEKRLRSGRQKQVSPSPTGEVEP